MVAYRAQVAAVIQLQEARTELGHIDFDRALGRTGFAGQTAGHRLFDLVREVIFPLRACQLFRVRATSERRLTPCSGSAFSSWLGSTPRSCQQAQPFTHQRRAPFRRVDALVADFHRRTHRTLDVKAEAQPVAITLHRPAPAAAHRDGDLPIPSAALHRIDFHHRRVDPFRRTDFPGFRRLSGSKTALIFLSSPYSASPKKAGLYSARMPCRVRPTAGRHTSPSAPPRHRRSASSAPPAADRTYPAPGALQHPGINVAKHAVAQAVAVEQRAEPRRCNPPDAQAVRKCLQRKE